MSDDDIKRICAKALDVDDSGCVRGLRAGELIALHDHIANAMLREELLSTGLRHALAACRGYRPRGFGWRATRPRRRGAGVGEYARWYTADALKVVCVPPRTA